MKSTTTPILAVDPGKFNSVLCWYEPANQSVGFRTVRTTPDLLRVELLRQPVRQVVFEACAQAGWVRDLCEQLGLDALVVSTTATTPPSWSVSRL